MNGLLGFFPTTSTVKLLGYNSLAYSLGAINSFLLDKYWTFGQKQRTTRRELARFTLITLCSIGWSTIILWLASTFLHHFLFNTTVWANASKVVAIVGTALISYLGMRLWVFVSKRPKKQSQLFPHPATLCRPHDLWGRPQHCVPLDIRSLPPAHVSAYGYASDEHRALLPRKRSDTTDEYEQRLANEDGDKTDSCHSLSIILPVYNEDAVIGTTLAHVLNVLAAWVKDFEVIVVNDGSTDRTGEIVSAIVKTEPRVRVVIHACNQGYGAALADGFAAATKELTFFMDSDGQFDIRDLTRLLLFINEYDAVIGRTRGCANSTPGAGNA